MEGLKKRATVAVAVLLVSGFLIAFTTRSPGEPKTEQWMLENSPTEFGDYTMYASDENPLYSYKMDERTYSLLGPFGIVARVFTSKTTGASYDAVLIASRSKDSFHDPRICFSAQGWAIADQREESVTTKTRGVIPVTIVIMDGPDGRNKLAAFLYKGPGGYYSNTQRVKWAMFFEQLWGGDELDGVFYRIIPNTEEKDAAEKLKVFVAEFVDAANGASGGYF